MLKKSKIFLIRPKLNQIWLHIESNTLFKIENIIQVHDYFTAMEFSNYSKDFILILSCKKQNNFVYLKEDMSNFNQKYIFIKNK